MTPPEAPANGSASHGDMPPAVSVRVPASPPADLVVLTNRRDFLAAARARRQGTKAMMLQARLRRDDEDVPADAIRIGFTCSKKVGNAVARNRAKRRMREIARLVLPTCGTPGWDYVLIGRKDETATRDFAALQADLKYALRKVHTDR